MPPLYGMNPDAVAAAASKLMVMRASLEEIRVTVPAVLDAVGYPSRELSEYQYALSSEFLPMISKMSQMTESLAATLRQNVLSQQQSSDRG